MAGRAKKTDSRRALNRWTAHAMPVVLCAILGWATWVFVALVCINHLLLGQKRRAAAVVLLTLYFVLLLLMGTAYLRTVIAINFNPSYVPKGPAMVHSEKSESITMPHVDADAGVGDAGYDEGDDVESGLGSARSRTGVKSPQPPDSSEYPEQAMLDGSMEVDEEDEEESHVEHAGHDSATAGTPEGSEGEEHDNTGSLISDQHGFYSNSSRLGDDMSMQDALRSGPLEHDGMSDAGTNGGGPSGSNLAAADGPATIPTTNITLPVPSRAPRSSTSLHPRRHRKRLSDTSGITQGTSYSYMPPRPTTSTAPGNMEEFTSKDAFVCESDGRPRWCGYCNCWKPDRSHHCSEVDRCVYRMDHFCPWVGGVVAESSYKYFFQAVSWATVYCVFVLITMAIMISEKSGNVNSNWVGLVAVAALFGLFAGGMTGSTLQMMARNISTIDQLSHKTKVYQIAIHDSSPNFEDGKPRVWHGDRCFVITKTQPGENPWRLPKRRDNIRQVLGPHWWLWWLPVGKSPFRSREWTEGLYQWNPELYRRLKKEAGIQESE